MKAATLYRLAIGLIIACSLLFGYTLLPTQARAEDFGFAESFQSYSQEELAQMLAPIALYPDALLSQILMAATYPIEVVEADRWRKRNPNLRDDGLDDALVAQNWDPSVKALCHFPDILALMSERIGDTTDLGNAFLAQEAQVMDTVQQLRAAAYARGNLPSNDRQTVVVEKETIIIEPADPRVIYVPYYDPYTIYGRWWYPAYSPWYWGPPRASIGFGLYYWPGFYFSFSVGNWCYFDWHRRYIHIDIHKRPRYVRRDRWHFKPGRWQHAPVHRRGVAYRDIRTARKYGQTPRALHDRRDNRGVPQGQVLNRNGRSIDRNRQDRQRVDRQQAKRTIQTRHRVESDRQRGAVTRRTRQEQPVVQTNRSIRAMIERDRKQRDKMTTQTRQQRQINRGQPTATRSAGKQPQQVRAEQKRTKEQPTVRHRQNEQRAGQAISRPRLGHRQQLRDKSFPRVDQGSKERQTGGRDRASRQVKQSNPRSDIDSRGLERNLGYRGRY